MSNQESSSNPSPNKPRHSATHTASNPEPPESIHTEYGFALAVHQALRDFQRPDHLRANPLLSSRLVTTALAQSPATPPTQVLRELLRRHCEALGENPKTSRFQQVLQHTYLTPLRSQQAVADALHLSWSTYRRCLADATGMLTTLLWEAETALHPPQSPRARHQRRWIGYSAAAVAVLLLGVAGAAYLQIHRRRQENTEGNPSLATLAVLPFVDLDQSDGSRYLSDGITDELITRLGRNPQLRVVAHTSSFSLRDKPLDVREVGRILDVGNVIEGSVQQNGGDLRIHVALVSTANGYELWSDEVSAPRSDIFKTEQAISDEIMQQLHLSADPPNVTDVKNHALVNPEARDAYLVGMEYLSNRTVPDIKTAIGYFQKSIQEDPNYADSWAGLALAYAVWRDYTDDERPDTRYDDALQAVNRAIALDPSLSMAHAVLGLLYEEHWDWLHAKLQFQLALKLDPSNATAHQWYAIYFWLIGEPRQSVKPMQTAHDLDPLSPIINADLGRALSYAGSPQQAAIQFHTSAALAPQFGLTFAFMAENDISTGNYARALADIHTASTVWGGPTDSFLLMETGVAEVGLGHKALARKALAELQRRATAQHYLSGANLAPVHWSLDEQDQAFAELQRAARDHDHLLMIVAGPIWAGLRADPRYAQVRSLMNLPVSAIAH